MVGISNFLTNAKANKSASDLEREVNTYQIDRTILHIRQALRREWEDDVTQRRQFSEDKNKGKEDAASKVTFLERGVPKYYIRTLIPAAVGFIARSDRFSRIGQYYRTMKSKIEDIEKEVQGIIASGGLTGNQYEWPIVSKNLFSRRQSELDNRVAEMETQLDVELQKDEDEIEKQTLEIQSGGGDIEMDELRSYEEKNRMLRLAFYAAITFFVLAEAIVNGVGLEGMGFSPLTAFIGAGFLGGFIFWSAHLLGSYIKQNKFYYPKDKKKKQLAFTILFVIIAAGILMFFTYTRHDYLVQLQTQSQPVVIFGETELADATPGSDDGNAAAFSSYDYLFIFINVVIYFLGFFVAWLISPKSKALKKLYHQRAIKEKKQNAIISQTKEEGRRKIERELQDTEERLEYLLKFKSIMERKIEECITFYGECVANLARIVFQRLGHYVDGYRSAAPEGFFAERNDPQEEIREKDIRELIRGETQSFFNSSNSTLSGRDQTIQSNSAT